MYNKLIILPILLQLFVVYYLIEASKFGQFAGNAEEAILSRVSISEDETVFTLRSKDRFVGFLSQAYLKASMNSTGWNILEVRTNPDLEDDSQAYYGGLIEGCISKDLIYQHWYNTKMNYCDKVGKEICANIIDYIRKNEKWMEEIAEKYARKSSYWWQVFLNYVQIIGIFDGYNICSGGKIISYLDFLFMNMDGDLEDLEDKFKPKESPPRKLFDEGRCSAIIKLLPNNEDLYVAHDTWTSYNYLIRMQKRYIFSYHELPQSTETVPGRIITFSGYPGVISSIDDFYTISSNIAIQETTIGNSNKAIWKYVTPIGTVPEFIRVMVANRLAKSGRDWGRMFAKLNSGTYNNQWMIIDYNKFIPYQEPQKGLLWILEQVPGYVRGQDKTELLKKKTYWPSYNIPYYEDIFNMSGNAELVKQYGDWFSYYGAPRSKIMERDHHTITNLDTLMTFMRSNNYKNDPLSRCECSPPYSASNAIASRHDLNKADGTYPIPYLGQRPGGAIDAKLTSSSLMKDLQFIAVSGPTKGTNLPVFKWSTSNFQDKLKHIGQPDEWDFQPIKTEWTLNLP